MKIKDWIQLTITITFVYAVLHFLGIGCPIIYLTGIPCAGCGMTRAWLCVLKLNFPSAYNYHPLFWIPPIVLVVMAFKRSIPVKLFNTIIWLIALIFIIVYLIRLFNPEDTVVKININKSAIWHCLNYIIER
jgi:hypothetical protein